MNTGSSATRTPDDTPTTTGGSARRTAATARTAWAERPVALGRAAALWALSLSAGLVACLVNLAIWLLGAGVGLLLLPLAVGTLRRLAGTARRRAGRWTGVAIPEPYRPTPPREPGLGGRVRTCLALLGDPATWRDLVWASADPWIGGVIAGLPGALVLYGVYGALVQPFVWGPIDRAGGSNWYTVIQVDSSGAALAAVPVGLALILAGLLVGPWTLRLHARWTAVLLAPTRTARLRLRVDHLSTTRADASDAQAAELRRIERDLHDGAQARLVALGMTIDSVEKLVNNDPQAALSMLAGAREASSRALEEMRDLIRGIHPPVLADRGIADAVRALALDSMLDVEVTAELPGRPAAPVESAVYFAVSELLTNAAKHSGAGRVEVRLGHRDGVLAAEVTDDGRGGADPARGTGLRGVQRRIAVFDGTLTVRSPDGGPTAILLEIPCALSSPKTSSS
ncbi:sensor histidine kinase [Kitasatospora sp. NPDC088548]|uniref:sensor histidine kinase n=1 Tax=Kitasatospora sp. NPDC088548 TaxID=3364075 RepID=UPI00382E2CC1